MTEVMWFLNIGVLAVELIISLVIIYIFLSEMRKNRVKGFRFQTLFMGPIAVLSKFS